MEDLDEATFSSLVHIPPNKRILYFLCATWRISVLSGSLCVMECFPEKCRPSCQLVEDNNWSWDVYGPSNHDQLPCDFAVG